MTRRDLFFLALAFLAGAFLVQPVRYIGTAAQTVDMSDLRVEFKPGEGGYFEAVTIRYADGTVFEYHLLATPAASTTPAPTDTPTPSITPPIAATETLLPFPTPTIDSTPLPTPDSAECVMRVKSTALPWLNVRDAPAGNKIGEALPGDLLKVQGKTMVGAVMWLYVYGTADMAGFVHGGYVEPVSGDCALYGSAAWLIHVVPGYNANALQASYPILANSGIGFGVKPYADITACLDALDRGGVCIYRYPVAGDCPAQIGTAEPVASAREWMTTYSAVIRPLMSYADSGRLWIELVNECYYGEDTDIGVYYWWQTWLNTAIDYVVAHDWPPVVAPTFGPGYGDNALQYATWKPALLKLADWGGLIGLHAYTPYHDQGLCLCDEWTACRHRRNYAALLGQGIELDYAITESAKGWGNDPVSVEDFVCWWNQIKTDPGLRSVALWLGGHHPTWPLANLDDYYTTLARAIAQ